MRRLARFVLVGAPLVCLAGCERYSLDRKMEELCKKDGGVKVYETVTLPASEFSPEGLPLYKYQTLAKSREDYLGPDYRYVEEVVILVGKDADIEKGEGRLTRRHTAIYRRSDGRLLGESVSYGRGGGDGFMFGFAPSGNHCPNPRVNLLGHLFLKGI
jgi:hypothetical protein